MKPYCIVHIITGLGGGGAERMVLELANSAIEKSENVMVISVTNSNTLSKEFSLKGINHHFLGITSFINFFKGFRNLKNILSGIENPVVHSHMFHSCMLIILYKICTLKRIPVVFTMHTNTVKQFHRRMLLFLTKVFRNADIIFSSNSKKWYLKNSYVIPNGVDFNKFKRTKPREDYIGNTVFKFLFLGRLYTPKNPLFLIQIVQNLITKGFENFNIWIVGDGVMRKELERKIEQEGLKDYFKMIGFQKDVTSFLNDSQCLIIPSLREGMPVSIIEASACKLPIIATPVGSIPDFLNHNNAVVTKLSSFSEKMLQIVNNYESALKRSELLYDFAKSNWTIEKVYKKHLLLYLSYL